MRIMEKYCGKEVMTCKIAYYKTNNFLNTGIIGKFLVVSWPVTLEI